MCEGESLQPEGQLEEDLMAADFTVCLCCHLIYAEAIGIHTLFHILSFQEKKRKNTLHIPHPKKERKKQESRCDFYALLSVSDNNLRQRKRSRTDWHHNADSGSVILCGRSR